MTAFLTTAVMEGHGRKNSRFWASMPWLLPLAASCPGDNLHRHKTWHPQIVDGKVPYPKAEEAAYPTLFCARMAELVRDQWLQKRVVDAEDLAQQLEGENPSCTE